MQLCAKSHNFKLSDMAHKKAGTPKNTGLPIYHAFMSDKKPHKPSPFCLRLSKEERARLEYEAGDMPLGTYARSRLFNDPTPRKRRMKRPVKDHKILAELITKLGASRISSNLNQLARAANSGSLLLMPEVEENLRQALSDIAWMRKTLMKSLGLYQSEDNDHDP